MGEQLTSHRIHCSMSESYKKITNQWPCWWESNRTFVLSTEKSNGYSANSISVWLISSVDIHPCIVLYYFILCCMYFNWCIAHFYGTLYKKKPRIAGCFLTDLFCVADCPTKHSLWEWKCYKAFPDDQWWVPAHHHINCSTKIFQWNKRYTLTVFVLLLPIFFLTTLTTM